MGTTEHTAWIQKAAKADVDAIQSGNAPKIAADQDYTELFETMQGDKTGTYTKDWSDTLTNPARSLHAITACTNTLKLETPVPTAQPDPPKALSRNSTVGGGGVSLYQSTSTLSTRALSMKAPAGKASSISNVCYCRRALPTPSYA